MPVPHPIVPAGGARSRFLALLACSALAACGAASAPSRSDSATSGTVASGIPAADTGFEVATTEAAAPDPVVTTIVDAAAATTVAEREPGRRCAAVPAGDRVMTVTSAGVRRSAIVHVPPGYDGSTVPMVLDFHGHGGTSEGAQRRHGFDALADHDTVIVAYPQGLVQLDGLNGWNTGSPGRDGGTVDDVAFTDDLIAALTGSLCIDPARIFVTGHSNGGGMTGLLACRRPASFAAFAPVSGAFYPVPGGCEPAQAAAILEIHGLDDAVVPYAGNLRFAPVVDWLAAWAGRNGCTGSTTAGDRTTWNGCSAPLEHVALPGVGHGYPDGSAALVWEFFKRRHL